MHKVKALVLTTALLAQCSAMMRAQDAICSLDSCLKVALDSNLTVRASTLEALKAKDMEPTYLEFDPTEITLAQDPTSGGSPDNSLSVTQSFSMPSVYRSRHKQLKAQTSVARARTQLSRNELAMQVTSAYYTLLRQRATCRLLQRQDSILGNFMRIAAAKHSNGAAGALERMNAEREQRENSLDLANALNDYDQAHSRLQKLLNTSRTIAPQEQELQPMGPGNALAAFDAGASVADSVNALEVKASELELNCIKKGFLPSVSVSLRGQLLIKGFNPYNVDRERFEKGNFMGFELGVSVPLSFGALRGKVRAAQRDVEAAKLNRMQQAASMQNVHKQLLNEYAKAKQAVDYYTAAGLPQAAEMERLSQLSYSNGEIDYTELAQNLKSANDVRLSAIEAIDRYNQVVIKLNYINGKNY